MNEKVGEAGIGSERLRPLVLTGLTEHSVASSTLGFGPQTLGLLSTLVSHCSGSPSMKVRICALSQHSRTSSMLPPRPNEIWNQFHLQRAPWVQQHQRHVALTSSDILNSHLYVLPLIPAQVARGIYAVVELCVTSLNTHTLSGGVFVLAPSPRLFLTLSFPSDNGGRGVVGRAHTWRPCDRSECCAVLCR